MNNEIKEEDVFKCMNLMRELGYKAHEVLNICLSISLNILLANGAPMERVQDISNFIQGVWREMGTHDYR